jgi:uncharacterized membrane protein YcaP (DUF421 family)
MEKILGIAIRVFVVYVYYLILVRVLGKREIGAFSAIDFVVALMLGDMANNMIFQDVTLLEGGAAVAGLGVTHFFNSFLSCRSRHWDRWVGGTSTPLIENGRILERNLRAERLNRSELLSHLRENGITEEDIDEIELTNLEPDGRITVILRPEFRPVQRKDLPGPAR